MAAPLESFRFWWCAEPPCMDGGIAHKWSPAGTLIFRGYDIPDEPFEVKRCQDCGIVMLDLGIANGSQSWEYQEAVA